MAADSSGAQGIGISPETLNEFERMFRRAQQVAFQGLTDSNLNDRDRRQARDLIGKIIAEARRDVEEVLQTGGMVVQPTVVALSGESLGALRQIVEEALCSRAG